MGCIYCILLWKLVPVNTKYHKQSNKNSAREIEIDGNLHKNHKKKKKKKKQVFQPCRFITATTFTGIPLSLASPQNQGYHDLAYINSQGSFPNTAQDFESDQGVVSTLGVVRLCHQSPQLLHQVQPHYNFAWFWYLNHPHKE